MNFDESSDDEDNEAEKKEKGKHKPPERLEVASDESDFEDDGDDAWNDDFGFDEDDYDYEEEDLSQYSSGEAEWKTPVDLAKDFMGSLAFVGQAIFAPWTLPGQPFSVDPKNLPQHQNT